MALRVAAAVGDHHRDHRRDPLLRDQVVEDAAQVEVRLAQTRTIMRDQQRGRRAGYVLGRDVHGDRALVVDGMRRDDQGLRVLGVRRAELLARDARVEALAILRVHDELLHAALRDPGDGLRLGGGHVIRAHHEIPVDVGGGRRARLALQADELRGGRTVERPGRRLRASGRLGGRGDGLGRVGGEAGQSEEQEGGAEAHEGAGG